MSAVPVYPVRVGGSLDPQLSRWLWLVKWLLAIPHVIVLAFLWIGLFVLTVVAFFSIVFTGRYPRSIFDFNVGVLRWTWRVGFYSYSALGTDRYPPFSLGEHPEYPATLEVPYPEQLSRGLALVKWWLLAIPHYIVISFLVGGTGFFAWHWPWSFGLIGVLVFFAAVSLLFTARYPAGIFDVVLGFDRWAIRVAAYVGLMTDRYPPFRLDLGGTDPGAVELEGGETLEAAAPTAPAAAKWTGGKIVVFVLGALAALVSFGLLFAGGLAVVLDQTQRDSAGFLMTPTEDFETPTYALVSESVHVTVDGPDEIVTSFVGDVRIRSESAEPLFVGIAREEDANAYLSGVRHAVVTQLGPGRKRYSVEGTEAPTAPPAEQDFWVASASGAGEQFLRWEAEEGEWRIVAMNADASRGVEAELSVGAELDWLLWAGIALLAGGLAVGLLAAAMLYAGLPRARTE